MKTLLPVYQELPILKQELRSRVCSTCINGNGDGTCDVDLRHDCALFESIPRIADAVSQMRNSSVGDYTAVLQEIVCGQCFHQHLDGSCELRDQNTCALFRYLKTVAATIRHQEVA